MERLETAVQGYENCLLQAHLRWIECDIDEIPWTPVIPPSEEVRGSGLETTLACLRLANTCSPSCPSEPGTPVLWYNTGDNRFYREKRASKILPNSRVLARAALAGRKALQGRFEHRCPRRFRRQYTVQWFGHWWYSLYADRHGMRCFVGWRLYVVCVYLTWLCIESTAPITPVKQADDDLLHRLQPSRPGPQTPRRMAWWTRMDEEGHHGLPR